MPAQSRKQRELEQRHDLFLELGRELLHENGFHQLSMDLVAEKAEYSKGTIYQHFSCKEEMLIQLCMQCMKGLLLLGEKAKQYPGTHRERLLAFQTAHELWLNVEPRDLYMMQYMNIDGVMNKVADDSLSAFRSLEASIITLCASIFKDAMDDGDLPPGELNAAELVYGMWSMCYGGQLLRSYETPLAEMGVSNPGRAVTTLIQAMLNGLQWQPLMTQEQTDTLLHHLETDYFNETLAQLREGNA